MEQKAYKKEFYEEIFRVNYIFFLGSKKRTNNFIEKAFGDDDGIHESHRAESFSYYKSDKLIQCIWIESRKDVGGLIHEIVHSIISTLVKHRGERIEAGNSETAAYLAEYLYNKFIDKDKWKEI